jgi:hypothetical protein
MYMTTIIIHSTRRIVTCFQLSSWFFIPSQAPPFTCHFQRTSPRCEEHHRSTCTIAILFAKVTIVSCSTEGSNWNEMLSPPFHLIVGKGSIRTLPIERKIRFTTWTGMLTLSAILQVRRRHQTSVWSYAPLCCAKWRHLDDLRVPEGEVWALILNIRVTCNKNVSKVMFNCAHNQTEVATWI